ncbi:MAG: chorismate-binding protein [Gallionellaceae bacterium]|nr:chorismate-binding protein [Gallionellaceae bacterium]
MSQAHDALTEGQLLYRKMRALGGDRLPPSYLFHIPQSGKTWVGASPSLLIRYSRRGFEVTSAGRQTTLTVAENPFQTLRKLIDPSRPCFFMVSLDMQRRSHDASLPLMVFIQPAVEVCFTRDAEGTGYEVSAGDRDSGQRVKALLEKTVDLGFERNSSTAARPPSAWHTESDDEFLKRVRSAVEALQSTPGKMIVTRSYNKIVGTDIDPFRLFEIYSKNEPGAAAAHFASLDDRTFSLGCSPENVFELDHRRLSFDVVASTRGISQDPDEDARWLQELLTDSKERKEHLMAFERYQSRLEGLCEAGSISQEQLMGVRTLRRVRHLHSRLSGTLRPEIDFLDLLEDSYPPLSSYPSELVPLADADTEPLRYYGGIVGHAAPGGQEVSCFLNLRSALIKEATLYTQGGVGVIADSKPNQEVLEVANKLRSLLEAISDWERE